MKILWLSDDYEGKSGVGIQSYKVLTGLQKHGHEVVNIAGYMGQGGGIHEVYNDETGVRKYSVVNTTDPSVASLHQIREIVKKEYPDIFIGFHDPRLIINSFFADREIRTQCPFAYWHLWDSFPYPDFNNVFYESVDSIVCISKFTYDLLNPHHEEKMVYIPHGIDEKDYYPFSPEEREQHREQFRRVNVRDQSVDFVIFWNQRNMPRKRVGSLIEAYCEFARRRKNTLLIMHTRTEDPSGMNLPAVINKYTHKDAKIIISEAQEQPEEELNRILNISDVSINVCMNEGFGLSTVEAMFAGIPIIATDTGGLTPQLHSEEMQSVSGIALQTDATNLSGDRHAALYVTQDYVSVEHIVEALIEMYDMGPDKRREIGERGRQHAIKNFNIVDVVEKWNEHLVEVRSRWKPIPSFRVVTL